MECRAWEQPAARTSTRFRRFSPSERSVPILSASLLFNARTSIAQLVLNSHSRHLTPPIIPAQLFTHPATALPLLQLSLAPVCLTDFNARLVLVRSAASLRPRDSSHSNRSHRLSAQPPPSVNLNYPIFDDYYELKFNTSSVFDTDEPPAVYRAVLSLCHYFDCALVLSQARANCLLVAHEEDECDDETETTWNNVWPCFLLALQFDMKQVKEECMPLLANHCLSVNSHRQEWKRAKADLDKDTLLQMMLVTFDYGENLDSDSE